MSVFEPYPRSRLEKVAEIRPPLWPWMAHYARQWRKLPQHYRSSLTFVFKWSGRGILGIVLVCSITLLGECYHSNGLNNNAVKARKDRQATIEADQKRQQDAEEEHLAMVNAVGNWDRWQNTFMFPEEERLCYHAHFSTPVKVYEITCYVGTKGHTPTSTVICNQSACSVSPYAPPHR